MKPIDDFNHFLNKQIRNLPQFTKKTVYILKIFIFAENVLLIILYFNHERVDPATYEAQFNDLLAINTLMTQFYQDTFGPTTNAYNETCRGKLSRY